MNRIILLGLVFLLTACSTGGMKRSYKSSQYLMYSQSFGVSCDSVESNLETFLSKEGVKYSDNYPEMVCAEKQRDSDLYVTDCSILMADTFFTPNSILSVKSTYILTRLSNSCSITFVTPLDGQTTEESWLSRSPCGNSDDAYCKRRLEVAAKWASDFKNRFEWRTGESLFKDSKPNLFNLYFHQEAADYWNRIR